VNPGTPPPLVLHVIHRLATGGLENGLVNLINHLPPQRYRHAVACVEEVTDFSRRIQRPDTALFSLHRSRQGVWAMRRELYRLCRRLRPAIVHSRNQSGLDALLPAALAGVRHRVHGEHGWDMDDLHGHRFKPALLRRLHAPLVERYVTVSQDLAHYLQQRVHVRPQRISTVCNGVDTERFHPRRHGAPDLLPPGWAAQRPLVVGTVGRLTGVKDQASLLQAFAQLKPTAQQPLRLVLVGDGPLRQDLQSQAANLGIADATWFAGDRTDVPELMQQMDLFVLPSLNEGISNTLLEAMATGLPLLASRVGGNPELIHDGEHGRLLPAADPQALAQALQALVDQPALRQAWGAASRRRAEQHFSLEAMVAGYQQVYDQVLGRH
jgi:sugar transferase (PEP-CTERM/EpsH1 system associated)